MNHWLKDFKAAFNSLKRRPGFALAVILTLSLTLGAFISMFVLSYTVLFKPLPYPESDKLYVVQGERFENGKLLMAGIHSYPSIVDAYRKNEVFSETFIMDHNQQLIRNIPGQPKLYTSYTSPEFFPLMGAKMAHGRYFDPKEGIDVRAPVAVISYHTWQTYYRGGKDILSKKIQIEDVSFRIIGVLSETFVEPMLFFANRHTSVYMPFDFNTHGEQKRRNYIDAAPHYTLAGKIKEGVRRIEAEQYFTNVMSDTFTRAAKQTTYVAKGIVEKQRLRSIEDVVVGDSGKTSLMLLAGVFVLLLIAFANISNLFLSRAAEKQRQYAIQAALGAQKFHIFRGVFIEAFILMIVSAGMALLIAQISFELLQKYGQEHMSRLDELALNPFFFLFAIALAVLMASMFAVVISTVLDYRALNNMLRTSGKGSGLQISKSTRNLLVTIQVALAASLLSVNFSLLTDSVKQINISSGFNHDDILWVDIDSGPLRLNEQESKAYIRTIMAKFKQLPGVKSVSNSLFSPIVVNRWTSVLKDRETGHTTQVIPNVNLIDEYFFPIYDIDIVQGRNISNKDIDEQAAVIIINETSAKQFYGGDVVGKNLFFANYSFPFKVIGVSKDIALPRIGKVPQMFSGSSTQLSFMIRMRPGLQMSKTKLISFFRQIDRNFTINSYVPIKKAYQGLLANDIAVAAITVVLSVLTLLLAGLGIYGVLSYSINLRTYELGVRMAIGGSPKVITKLVFSDSSKPIVAGFAIGLLVLTALYIYLSKYANVGVTIDLVAVLLSLVVISATSMVACYLPLKKIVQSQPINSLR